MAQRLPRHLPRGRRCPCRPRAAYPNTWCHRFIGSPLVLVGDPGWRRRGRAWIAYAELMRNAKLLGSALRKVGSCRRLVTRRPNLSAALMCVPLVAFYFYLNIPHNPLHASVELYVLGTNQASASSYVTADIPITRIDATMDAVDHSGVVKMQVSVSFICPVEPTTTLGAMVSPGALGVYLGDDTRKGPYAYFADVDCAPGQRQYESSEIDFDRNTLVPEQSPGHRSFELNLSANHTDTPISLTVSVEHSRLDQLEDVASSSSRYATWSGQGDVSARGQLDDPLAASWGQLVSSTLLLVLGAIVGAIVANMVTRSSVTEAVRGESTTRPTRRRLRQVSLGVHGRIAKKLRRRR